MEYQDTVLLEKVIKFASFDTALVNVAPRYAFAVFVIPALAPVNIISE